MKKLVTLLLLGLICLSIEAKSNSGRVDINNENTENQKIDIQVKVVPNPVIETCELEFTLVENAKEVYIYIANSAGKIVSSLPIGETSAGNSSVVLSVDGLKGYYIVGIQAGKQSGTCNMFVK